MILDDVLTRMDNIIDKFFDEEEVAEVELAIPDVVVHSTLHDSEEDRTAVYEAYHTIMETAGVESVDNIECETTTVVFQNKEPIYIYFQ